jgi:acetyl-CoA carboxylase biotin carboxyl carrier protein
MNEPPKRKTPSNQELIRAVWEEARDLVKRLEGSTVQRFSVEAGDTKIEIERRAGVVVADVGGGGGTIPEEHKDGDSAALDGGHPIKAPLVGTFYRSSQPGAPPFVSEGDTVDAGQTVGIVEAMKLMNQVQADQAGKVSKILAEDGDWVEFEQTLMLLEPAE